MAADEEEDFLLALQLQEQFNNELSDSVWSSDHTGSSPVSKKRKVEWTDRTQGSCSRPVQPDRPLSIVDESWETLDPSPDVRAMFLQFNELFFWGKLSGVEVRWSPRMTLCAGVCSYEGRGGLCSIRLSEPLLKLRPRKDLVETLLHEMIHALLFVTQNNRDREGHGPEFCKHMNRINQASGTKISIYHSFHDEVDVYRQHWWRCNGPCQNRKPFFGYVKRAMNRAPSARDPWWEEHRRTCGGTYNKIKEPENYGKKGKSEEKKDKNASKKPGDKLKPASSAAASGSQDIRNVIPFSGRGFILSGSTRTSASAHNPSIRSATPSPKPLQEPSRSSAGGDHRSPSISTVVKLPKRSVSNHKAFININGSPVRVTKTSVGLARPKQSTVHDLFQSRTCKSPNKPIPTKTLNLNSTPSSSGASSSAGSPLSKYFTSPKGTGTAPITSQHRVPGFATKLNGSPGKSRAFVPPLSSRSPRKPSAASAGRKRWREEQNSAQMFDFFQRISHSPASSSLSREEGGSAEVPSAGASGAGGTLLSSTATTITVTCPVCQSQVPESNINQHLDSCLM